MLDDLQAQLNQQIHVIKMVQDKQIFNRGETQQAHKFIETLKKEYHVMSKDIGNVNGRLNYYKSEIDQLKDHIFRIKTGFVQNEPFDKFQDQVSKFMKKDQAAVAIEHTKLEMVRLTKTINGYDSKIDDVRVCVQDFDQAIALKANKCQISVIQAQLYEDFIKKSDWEQMKQNVKEQMELMDRGIKKFDQTFMDLNSNLSTVVFSACDKLMKQKYEKQDGLLKRFKHFTNVSEVLEKIEKKADLFTVEQLKQNKASYHDTDKIRHTCQKLQEQLSHLGRS